MFRMEFQSHVTEEEDDDDTSHSITGSEYQPAIFEGRVGHFGKVHRFSQSNLNGNFPIGTELIDSGHSPVCKGAMQDEIFQQAIYFDAQVLRELVWPFAALQHGSVTNVRAENESSPSSSSRFSLRSNSSSFRSDMSSPSEGSVAYLKALQREGKPWEEPLLALQQQNEVAAAETRRRDEEQRLEAITAQQELQDLANCVEFSPSHGSFKKNKLQKVLHKTGVAAVYRFFKNPFGLFKSRRIHNGYAAREGVYSVVMPRTRRVVSESYPSRSNAAVLQMRTASRRPARSAIEFATVNSTQRDVPSWTMEEYLRKNGKVHHWKRRKDDEELGGIEGNNLMNQNFNDGRHATYDSDSD